LGSAFNIPHSFFNRKEEKTLLLMDKGRKEIELKLCVSVPSLKLQHKRCVLCGEKEKKVIF